jgi:methyltransferase (TIGR00027 family)
MTDEPLIRNVSDTARWVAYYRAMETERPDAIFRDPYARRLAGERGEAIVNRMRRARSMAWPMIVRTAVMDEIILRCLSDEGVDCVLNLACGLDARPWRMPLPAALQWIDVDHPVMIDHKLTELVGETPRCRYEGVALDLADGPARRALFSRVGATAKKVLVISEGLLVYLPEAGVRELATDLHAQPSFTLWLTDLASPALLKMMSRGWGKEVAKGNAPFIFGPVDAPGFFGEVGWKETEFRPMFEEGVRLKRTMKLWWLWRTLGRLSPKARQEEFKRFSGVALLKRAAVMA